MEQTTLAVRTRFAAAASVWDFCAAGPLPKGSLPSRLGLSARSALRL